MPRNVRQIPLPRRKGPFPPKDIRWLKKDGSLKPVHRYRNTLSPTEKVDLERWAFELYRTTERKFEAGDVTADMKRNAEEYARSYDGNFIFMNDMKRAAQLERGLSDNMAKGVLNVMAHAGRDQFKPVMEKIAATLDRSVEEVRDGTYTVVFDSEDDRVTIKIKSLDDAACIKYAIPHGSKIASFLSGPDNTSDFRGFAWIVGRAIRPWKQFRENKRLVEAVKIIFTTDPENRAAMGERYALISGNCCKCGRKLTVPASIHRGMGPICAEGGWD